MTQLEEHALRILRRNPQLLTELLAEREAEAHEHAGVLIHGTVRCLRCGASLGVPATIYPAITRPALFARIEAQVQAAVAAHAPIPGIDLETLAAWVAENAAYAIAQ